MFSTSSHARAKLKAHEAMSVDTERLVLSEVHVGSSALDEEELVSRYTYLTPSNSARADSDADGSGSDSSSSGGESVGSPGSVTRRRRKRARCGASSSSSQRRSRPPHEVLTVCHRMATTLGLVGQQVWSAAFLLGDFVLTHEEVFAGMQVLELGAGPGVPGLVAARVAQRCYLTDYHQEVLKILARNVEANKHLFAAGRPPTPADADAVAANAARADSSGGSGSGGSEGDPATGGDTSRGDGGGCQEEAEEEGQEEGEDEGSCVAAVRELDWFTFAGEDGWPTDAAICAPGGEAPSQGQGSESSGEEGGGAGAEVADGNRNVGNNNDDDDASFSWREGELEGLSLRAQQGGGLVIVAADVIYDEGLTDAFFHVLKLLMPAPAPAPPVRGSRSDGGVSEAASGGEVGLDQTPAASSASAPSSDGEKPAVGGAGSSGVKRQGAAVLYLALEKRFNFSLEELSVKAAGYNALLRNVLDVTKTAGGVEGCEQRRVDTEKSFEGRRLPLSFQQCFHYHRSDAMELWEIRRRPDARRNT